MFGFKLGEAAANKTARAVYSRTPQGPGGIVYVADRKVFSGKAEEASAVLQGLTDAGVKVQQ